VKHFMYALGSLVWEEAPLILTQIEYNRTVSVLQEQFRFYKNRLYSEHSAARLRILRSLPSWTEIVTWPKAPSWDLYRITIYAYVTSLCLFLRRIDLQCNMRVQPASHALCVNAAFTISFAHMKASRIQTGLKELEIKLVSAHAHRALLEQILLACDRFARRPVA
jgi:hypothetical protein